MEKYVYLLEHSYSEKGHEGYFNLGVYSSEQEAEKAIGKLIIQPGFNKFPRNNFTITEIEIDYCDWSEGFVSNGLEDEEL